MSRKISPNRILMTGLIALVFIGLVLVTEYADRVYSAILLCIIIGICVLETRYAMGEKIPQQFDVLIWVYAILFGIPYFLFGYVGIVLFTLLIFIIGVTIAVMNNHNQGVLQNFAFILIYPALLLSTLFYINRSAASFREITPQIQRLIDEGLVEYSLRGELLLPFNTVGLALVFAVSCFSDMFALLVGTFFGKRKLAPDISPNKTVEGAIGGVAGGIIGAALVFLLFEGLPLMGFQLFRAGLPVNTAYKILDYCLIGFFGSLCTQVGDLLASWVKRECGIKDYSRLLGSHGGFMDRFDGIMLNSVFVSVIYLFIL